MNFYSIYVLLLTITCALTFPHTNNLNHFMHMQETNLHDMTGKFGSPRQEMYRVMPLFYQQHHSMHNPSCLPASWTCGPDLPACCHGLMCYEGNAKRGRFCVAKG